MSNHPPLNSDLILLKLGGSLITDKTRPRTPRRDVMMRLAEEIRAALDGDKNLRVVLGHGSGSFGHVPAKKYGTRQGVDTAEGWHGFAEVWYEARGLNSIVLDALHQTGLPAVSFPPSGAVTARRGSVTHWNLSPLRAALGAGLFPVVFGDVVFDETLGGTILSTEDIFTHLAKELHPKHILLTGLDAGVWADYPHCEQIIPKITAHSWASVAPALGGSAATDVTGGMAGKVESMLMLAAKYPGLEISIFSGAQPGNLQTALQGQRLGTRITSV